MPAKSKQQQKFMGMVHALNKGDIKPSDVSKSVKDVAKNIKKSDAEDFASTKHSGLPRKVKEQILNAFKEYANKMSGNKLGGGGSHDYAPQKGLRDDDGYEDESINEVGVNVWYIYKKANKNKNKFFNMLSDFRKKHSDTAWIKMLNYALEDFNENPKKYKTIDDKQNILFKNLQNKKKVYEGMFSTIDQIKQDSKDVRDFVKNVFKDRDFVKMKNDKEFIKYLKSIYESKGVPQNYMQGRTSDYHTALRGKNRDYSGGTNFKKNNHGHPDIEKDDEDQETNQLSVQQSKLKEEMGKLSSSERIELYKLYSKAMKAMPGSPNQKKLKVIINKLRKKADLKPLPINEATRGQIHKAAKKGSFPVSLVVVKNGKVIDQELVKTPEAVPAAFNVIQSKHKGATVHIEDKTGKRLFSESESVNEGISVFDERHFGKKGIIIMIDDNGKKVSAIFKDKKNADKFNRNKPSDIKKLLDLAKKTKFPKTIDEYGQRLDLSFIDDKEARLKGTPDPKDAIDRNIDEGTMIRLAGQIAQELLPKDTWSRYSNDGRKNKEFVKTIVKDLAQTLNQFYKSHNISVRIKENNIELNEIGLFPIQNYLQGIIPSNFIDTTTRQKKERLKSTLRDLKNTLNHFWKQHKIPYRVK